MKNPAGGNWTGGRRVAIVGGMNLPPENIFGHTQKLRWMRSRLASLRCELGRPISILDLGCGNGWAVTRFLGEDGDEVLGVDFHSPSIEYAQRSFGRPGLAFRCGDALSMEPRPGGWDAIVIADVLEHLDDPATLLSSCANSLARGGRILVSMPNGRGCFELESALSRVKIIGPVLLRATGLFRGVLNRTILHGVWTRAAAIVPADIPYNLDSPHVQFKSRGEWLRLFAETGMETTGECGLSVIGGPFTHYLFGASSALCRFNSTAATHIPAAVANNWAFELAPKAF